MCNGGTRGASDAAGKKKLYQSWVASNVRSHEAAGDSAGDATAVEAWVAGSLRSVLYYTVEDQIKRAFLDIPSLVNGTAPRRASSPPPAAQKLARGVPAPGLYRRWTRGVPAPG